MLGTPGPWLGGQLDSDRLFALDAHRRVLQATLRGFLADQLSSAVLRSSLDSGTGYDPALHARLAGELGLAGLTIPAEFGGLGLSQAEASVVHTELGRALYQGPFLPSFLAAGALLAAGDRAAAEYWLPRLADGSATGTVAGAGEDGRWPPGSNSVEAGRRSRTGTCGGAGGTSSLVSWRTSWWSGRH